MQGHQVRTSCNYKTKTLIKAFCVDCKTSLASWTEVKAHMGPVMWKLLMKTLPTAERVD